MEKFLRLLTDSSPQAGASRVKPKAIDFNIYGAYPDKINFIPLLHSNLAVFYSNWDEKAAFLRTFFNESMKNSASIKVFYYSLFEPEEEVEVLQDLMIDTPILTFREYRWGIEQLVSDWTEVKEEIKAERKKNEQYDSFHRKFNFVIFDINKTTPEVYKKLYSLLKDSRRERLFFILLSSSANNVPRVFHKIFDLAVYLGRDNQIICDYIHSDLGYGLYDIHQKHIGTAFVKGGKFLEPVHPLEYTQSRLGRKQEEELEREYNSYLKFLENLN